MYSFFSKNTNTFWSCCFLYDLHADLISLLSSIKRENTLIKEVLRQPWKNGKKRQVWEMRWRPGKKIQNLVHHPHHEIRFFFFRSPRLNSTFDPMRFWADLYDLIWGRGKKSSYSVAHKGFHAISRLIEKALIIHSARFQNVKLKDFKSVTHMQSV